MRAAVATLAVKRRSAEIEADRRDPPRRRFMARSVRLANPRRAAHQSHSRGRIGWRGLRERLGPDPGSFEPVAHHLVLVPLYATHDRDRRRIGPRGRFDRGWRRWLGSND